MTVSDTIRAMLPPGRLDAIKDNPRVLVDPLETDALRAGFAETGPDGAQMADMFLGSLNAALAWAAGNVFMIGAAAGVLSIGCPVSEGHRTRGAEVLRFLTGSITPDSIRKHSKRAHRFCFPRKAPPILMPRPPSMRKACPVMKLASSLAR